jgi:hypothetical protein
VDEEKRKLIETLKCRSSGASCGGQAHERRSGEILTQASASDPGRVKPKGASSGWRAKHTSVVRDSRKGQSPGTAAHRAGPHALVCGYIGERNGRWVLPVRKRPDTFRKEKAPKGKSQERRRCETKPARVTKGVSRQEGSQTLKAERGGQAKPV